MDAERRRALQLIMDWRSRLFVIVAFIGEIRIVLASGFAGGSFILG